MEETGLSFSIKNKVEGVFKECAAGRVENKYDPPDALMRY